jgi:hypothetical protein
MFHRKKAPRRSGLPDPTWQQVGIALIALGAFLIGAVTALEPARSAGSQRGVWETRGLWAGFVLTGLGVVAIVVTAWGAFSRWLDDRRTPFTLVYEPDDPECDYTRADGRTLRVRVSNISSAGVERVRVHMLPSEGHSYFLHIRHDNDPLRRLSREGEYLAVEQPEYFDVAYVARDGSRLLTYADQGITSQVTSDTVRMTLTTLGWRDGRSVVPLSDEFDLGFRPDGSMAFTKVTPRPDGRTSGSPSEAAP